MAKKFGIGNTTKVIAPAVVEQPKVERQYFDNAEFVAIWMNSDSVQSVADHFKSDAVRISAKASNLRSKGVKLPAMRAKVSEVDQLNTLIKKLSK